MEEPLFETLVEAEWQESGGAGREVVVSRVAGVAMLSSDCSVDDEIW